MTDATSLGDGEIGNVMEGSDGEMSEFEGEMDRLGLKAAKSVEEIFRWAVGRIPAVCPGWTNYNDSDPGITLLELFSWLKEIQDFHMEQTGAAHLLEFLKLLGGSRRGRRPGASFVRVDSHEGFLIPANTRFYAGDIPFEAVREQMVVEGNFTGFRCGDGDGAKEVTGSWLSSGRGISLLPFGTGPKAFSTFTIMLYRPLKANRPYGLYVNIQKCEAKNQFPVDEAAFDCHGFYPLAGLKLEYHSLNGFREVAGMEDGTYGFCQEGMLHFYLEGEMDQKEPELRFVLERCDSLFSPVIVGLSLSMVAVLQKETVNRSLLFRGNGFPNQSFPLDEPELYEEGLSLLANGLEENGGLVKWRRVTDFDDSRPFDCHYVLEEGAVRFGDSIHGLAPEKNVVIERYERTGGKAGNVKAGTIKGFPAGGGRISVTNEADVMGGFDGESVMDALNRQMKKLREPFCAVTAADYEELVRRIPGLCIEDCRAFSPTGERHVVALAIRPFAPDGRGVLNEAYKKNIFRYLEERRMVGTRIQLKSPEYYGFSVTLEAVTKVSYREAGEMTRKCIRKWAECLSFGDEISLSSLYGLIDSLACIRRITGLYLDFVGLAQRENFSLPPWGVAVLERMNCVMFTEE